MNQQAIEGHFHSLICCYSVSGFQITPSSKGKSELKSVIQGFRNWVKMFGDSENDVYFTHVVYTLTKDSSLETGQVKLEYSWEVNSTSYETNTCFTCFPFFFPGSPWFYWITI